MGAAISYAKGDFNTNFDNAVANMIIYIDHLRSDKNDKLIGKSFFSYRIIYEISGNVKFINNNVSVIFNSNYFPYSKNEGELKKDHTYIYNTINNMYDLTDNKWVIAPTDENIKSGIEIFAKVYIDSLSYKMTFL